MQQPETIEKLLQDLQSADAYPRMTAAEELGRRVPAEQRTLDALAVAAESDRYKVVRSAAAKSYLKLTGGEQSQPSRETAATVTKPISTASVLRVLQSAGKMVLAAILSCVPNISVIGVVSAIILAYSQQFAGNSSGVIVIGAILVVVLIANLLVAIYFARVRQFSLAAGITVGLVCSLAIEFVPLVLVDRPSDLDGGWHESCTGQRPGDPDHAKQEVHR